MPLLVRLLIASVIVMIFAAAPGPAGAASDTWGCNYDKCIASCLKAGGKHCTTYCERRLQEKRRDKICK